MKKVACYCRVSSEEQADRATIQAQREALGKHCQDRGWEVVGWYCDDGVSGDVPFEKRKSGRQLLADAKAGKFAAVLAYKIDRLGRKTRDNLRVVELLHDQLGLEFSCSSQPFEVNHATGRLMLTMLAGFAEFEKTMILERTKAGLDRIARAGRWCGGRTPYGYMVSTEGEGWGYLVVDPLEGPVVRRIFELQREGLGLKRIAAWLNDHGIPSPHAGDKRRSRAKRNLLPIWRPSGVWNIIRSPIYYDRGEGLGECFYNKTRTKREEGRRTGNPHRDESEWVPRTIPALVSLSEWEEAQRQFEVNKTERTRPDQRFYPLRGCIVCGECGYRFSGFVKTGAKNGRYNYRRYGCVTRWNRNWGVECHCPTVNADMIEEKVWGRVREIILDPEKEWRLDQEEEGTESSTEQVQSDLNRITADLAALEKRERRCLSSHSRGLYDVADDEAAADRRLGDELREVNAERSSLNRDRARLEALVAPEVDLSQESARAVDYCRDLQELVEKADQDAKLRSELIRALVYQITVTGTEREDGRRGPHAVMVICPTRLVSSGTGGRGSPGLVSNFQDEHSSWKLLTKTEELSLAA